MIYRKRIREKFHKHSSRSNRFELLIDWGWFYFITKPMFKAIDFFFRLVGDFGLAILIVNVLVIRTSTANPGTPAPERRRQCRNKCSGKTGQQPRHKGRCGLAILVVRASSRSILR